MQYGLTQGAVGLGWATSQVLVIDEDLGHSASGIEARPGFQRLVSEVGLDHVGLVLGIEMSRLARSGREWHQFLELCALSGALLADPDGVYDPAEHNDRLLLGVKGTISEAELHLIKQRMWNGRIGKARRGELAMPLPVGYLRRVRQPREVGESVERIQPDLIIPTGKRKGQSPSVASIYRALAEHAKREAYPEALEQARADFAALQSGEVPGPRLSP